MFLENAQQKMTRTVNVCKAFLWDLYDCNGTFVRTVYSLRKKRVPKEFCGCPRRRTLFGSTYNYFGFHVLSSVERVLFGTKRGSSKGSPMDTAKEPFLVRDNTFFLPVCCSFKTQGPRLRCVHSVQLPSLLLIHFLSLCFLSRAAVET